MHSPCCAIRLLTDLSAVLDTVLPINDNIVRHACRAPGNIRPRTIIQIRFWMPPKNETDRQRMAGKQPGRTYDMVSCPRSFR